MDVAAVYQRVRAVCFDVDSTVCIDEGIDKLAEYCGVGQAVAEWTARAMGGSVTFQDSFAARLDIIKPTTAQVRIQALVEEGPKLTPGVREVVAALQARGVQVFLVTGGIRPLILPVAAALNISPDNIFANVLHHDATGAYVDFDRNQPTSRTGGKQEVARLLREERGLAPLIMIGDGATDMEARPPADAFIGFGGNVVREKVKAGADWFISSFDELLALEKSQGASS
ncbi:uncharacterized protein MONBRDRAFT_16456 [Monosiga brevicollis MX1]|uniref:phosphoserine phosphatase n=1 Tax=Monosiga brevicollis TaxID=81824 RepID=A9UX52_MONBE|nr:uncharacterized protein MONBRDRAFT_16456 [Monosiga brevicollis MX1]EDQ90331.1 predicted protein [Monosiga brevicollis MX1]|eukprot:XP_001745098.1 hypothetical protein [Monosiga brevicollis MX1]